MGYGSEHERRRLELLPHAYGTPCPRCGLLMLRGQVLDLGHTKSKVYTGNPVGDRIEHAACNRGDGQRVQRERAALGLPTDWMRKGLL